MPVPVMPTRTPVPRFREVTRRRSLVPGGAVRSPPRSRVAVELFILISCHSALFPFTVA
jgi:hypothetical protein